MMRKEGRAAPMVVQMAPGSFFSLYPTKTLMFMARAPGQLCATAMRSKKLLTAHPFLPVHHFCLYSRYHGISTTECEQSYL